ncbi:MAG TPA: DUF302 domain-containing protein [Candidatus Limnocylindrales bacterium]|nr:DUF302 domain-containing protein [Candidatus Limnocylindrales bacterium]
MQSSDANEYGDVRTTNLPFDEAVAQVDEALKNEGFGVLCRIDIQAKLKEKLGIDFPGYVILGACNPPLAYEALQKDINLGLLLPCNAVVYEHGGKVCVGAVNPMKMLAVADRPELEELARQVNEKLRRALDRVAPPPAR